MMIHSDIWGLFLVSFRPVDSGPRSVPVDAIRRAKYGISILEEGRLKYVVGARAHELDVFEFWGFLLGLGQGDEAGGNGNILPLFHGERGLGRAEFFMVPDYLEVGKPGFEGVKGRRVGVDGPDDEKLVTLEGPVVVLDHD